MPSPRVLAVPLVVALAAAGLTACSEDGDDAIAVGDVAATEAVSEPLDGLTAWVTVPTGTLEVEVAEPATEVGEQQAVDGARLLRLTTAFQDAEVRADVWAFAAREGSAEPVTLALDVEGDRYDLGVVRHGASGGDDLVPDDALLAVPDDVELDDVAVVVGYDGLDQTVSPADGSREPSPADPLYDEEQRGRSVDCSDGLFRPRLSPQVRCRAGEARLLPYLPGLGWAERGRAWLVVSVGAEMAPFRVGAAGYAAGRVRNRTQLDDQDPVARFDEKAEDGSYSAQLAFDVPRRSDSTVAGALQIRLDYRLRLAAGDAPPGGGPDDIEFFKAVVVPAAAPTT